MALDLTTKVILTALAIAMPQIALADELEPRPAAGGELFYSSDSEDTEILRTAIDFDLRNQGKDRRLGVRVENAWYDPAGSGQTQRQRIFLQAADRSGNWNWAARVGTDGDTIIGSASLHDNSKFRKEVFIERDIVETRQGLDQGIYSTFAGAAIDLPLNDRNIVTALVGLQAFTGDNVRTHLRGNYVHVLKPDWGLSVQLRGRYFRSSDPREFDYYSPKWYAEAMPVVQLRRFVDGWEVVGAGGIGVQRDSATDWRQSNFAQFRVRSPENAKHWSLTAEITYTDTPSDSASAGSSYSYFQTRLGIMRRF
ncbi:hypothetical protein [Parasphingorhabdus sp.]|uniref:hypothetical protein n=1 Tax=Parasphingorhabdus sp. TaxID=2709688 RepID=UPI003002CED3